MLPPQAPCHHMTDAKDTGVDLHRPATGLPVLWGLSCNLTEKLNLHKTCHLKYNIHSSTLSIPKIKTLMLGGHHFFIFIFNYFFSFSSHINGTTSAYSQHGVNYWPTCSLQYFLNFWKVQFLFQSDLGCTNFHLMVIGGNKQNLHHCATLASTPLTLVCCTRQMPGSSLDHELGRPRHTLLTATASGKTRQWFRLQARQTLLDHVHSYSVALCR